jgi:Zn-dependent M28 family amino/carboxypeptidase
MHTRIAGAVVALACAVSGCAASFPVDGGRAHARVVRQVEMGPRIPGSPGHDSVRTWIAAELARLGSRVEIQSFADTTLGRPLPIHNLIGRFGPTSGRRLMLCAHYDTRWVSDQDPDPAKRATPLPGANDGGSGVAVLLEVAELMHRTPPPVGVDLVFFDGEDQGRASRPEEFSLGARGFAARLARPGDPARPVAAFLFDLVGDRDLNVHPEVYSVQRASNLTELVLEGARATGAKGFRTTPRFAITDDHVPLLDAGLPAVDVIDFDYPAWHTTADTPDKVSAESLAEVAKVAAWLVYRSPLARP